MALIISLSRYGTVPSLTSFNDCDLLMFHSLCWPILPHRNVVEKLFLFDIIANKRNAIGVDKWVACSDHLASFFQFLFNKIWLHLSQLPCHWREWQLVAHKTYILGPRHQQRNLLWHHWSRKQFSSMSFIGHDSACISGSITIRPVSHHRTPPFWLITDKYGCDNSEGHQVHDYLMPCLQLSPIWISQSGWIN